MKYIVRLLIAILFVFTGTFASAQISAITFDTDIETENLSDEEEELLITQLKIVLLQLQVEITRLLQAQNNGTVLLSQTSCPNLTQNMYIGDTGSQVTLLQQFLANLGPTIYPEAQVTGRYGALTRQAVERFQVLTGIFAPGKVGYGVTGPVTRETISNYCSENSLTSNQSTQIVSDTNTTQDLGSIVPSTNISSSLQTNQGSVISNSALFNPNSSSIFLQYLQESQITGSTGVINNQTIQTITSPSSKTISFVGVENEMTIGESYTISFSQQNFSGFDLVSLEGYRDDIQYFFGSTVPALGNYDITIPNDFKGKETFTLVIKHNNTIKDSETIQVIN